MLVIREILAELRRRRVFRTAGLYIVAAWVVLQVADLAFESWGFPGTSLRPIWVAALLLFPVALLFGWRYDVTSRGVIRTTHAGSGQPVPLEPGYVALVRSIEDDLARQARDFAELGGTPSL